MREKTNYRIGCSGYYYPSWKNAFYPKEIKPKDWLQYYSAVFNTVELNGTFYRTPKLADLKKYASVTSDDFVFSVKMNKFITHNSKLNNSKKEISGFQDLILHGLGKKLNYFLFQMPPSFHFNEENIERVVENIPHGPRNVVEFRHESWWNENVIKVLANAGITFCNVDFPGLRSRVMSSTNDFYFRFHGKPELFKSAYTKRQLSDLYRKIPTKSKSVTVYFNNTYYGEAYKNALQLVEIIQKKK
ncbi:MAG: DUF72 domain-containing protein [Bacteroidia bacterium]